MIDWTRADRPQRWHLENKYTGAGETFQGTFAEACRAAWDLCGDYSRYIVWDTDGDRNERAAEVTLRGAEWYAAAYRDRAYCHCEKMN